LRNGYWTTHTILRLKPWSFSAFLIALTVLAAAILVRMAFGLLGATFYYATFLPAVLLASLVAGVPAGACAALLAIPIVWWAFLPPMFEFSPLTSADYNDFAMFLLGSSLLIWFAQLCREALITLERLESLEEF
jgi:K+-sensing histidine kinase KdpD